MTFTAQIAADPEETTCDIDGVVPMYAGEITSSEGGVFTYVVRRVSDNEPVGSWSYEVRDPCDIPLDRCDGEAPK